MNWLVVLGIIGISQGLYLMLISWTLSYPLKVKAWLNILMFCHIILLLSAIFHEMGWYGIIPHFLYVRVPIPLLIGPTLLFLYSTILTDRYTAGFKYFFHYIPFLIYLVILAPYFQKASLDKFQDGNIIQPDPIVDLAILEHFKIIHLFAYLFFIGYLYYKYRNKEKFQNLLGPFRKLFLGIVIVYMLVVIINLFNIFLLNYGLSFFYGIEVFNSILITLLASSIVYVFMKYEAKWLTVKRKRTKVKIKVSSRDTKLLMSLMEEEKLFRDNDLKINDLSERMSISRQQLSSLLNDELETSFPDFVNAYRIEDFKSRVTDPKEWNKTLLGMAFDSGFSSKSSFQRIFKKAIGMTPSQYSKSVKKNKSQNQ